MDVVRFAAAAPYTAPKHFDMRSLRLAGFGVGIIRGFSVGLSHFLPGGGAERDSSPSEKVYVVVSGEITVITDDGETTLGAFDSCSIGPNEARAIENRTNAPASMLVVIGSVGAT